MRQTCAVVLLALVALASVFAVGTASATTLCESKNEKLCPPGERYAEKQKIQASLKAGTLFELWLGTTTDIQCNESSFKGETIKNEGAGAKLTFETGVWTAANKGAECVTKTGGKCAVKWTGLPYAQGGITPSSEGNGLLKIEKGATVEVVCEMAKCIYAKAPLEAVFIGGNPAQISFLARPLDLQMGSNPLCPSKAELTAFYVLTEPANKPVWVSKEP